MRRLALALALCSLVSATGGSAGPLTQDACPGGVTVSEWTRLGNDVLENLVFADGSLWVSDNTSGSVRRLEADGSEGTGLTGIPAPGGLVQAADGTIYAGWGNSAGNAIFRTGDAKVVRFDPSDPDGTMTVVAEGLNMPNGMTLLPDGALLVSNDFDHGLMRIDLTSGAVSEFAHVWGTNGLVVDAAGDTLYAAVTFDQRSPIARISIDDPSLIDHDIQLSYGAVSLEPAVHPDGDASAPLLGVKGLDDMTRDAAGILYVVANGTGELLQVDPVTGAACLIAGGLQNPSSVRIAPPGPFAETGGTTFYVTEFSGAIRKVVYAPAA